MKAETMRRSSNEFCATLAKAGVAAGLPPDLAEEVALAAAVLCAHGEDGVAAAMHSLRGGMATAPPPQRSAGRITTAPTCAAAATIAVAEALSAAWHSAEPCQAVFDEVDSPLLLAGLVAVAAGAQQLRYALTFHSKHSSGAADAAEGVTVHIPDTTCLLPPALAEYATFNARLQVSGACSVRTAAPPQGIEVHPAAWSEVEALAAQTRVSASASSRHEGAGAGEIDND